MNNELDNLLKKCNTETLINAANDLENFIHTLKEDAVNKLSDYIENIKGIKWYTASKFSHPYDFEDNTLKEFIKEHDIPEKKFKYTKYYQIMVITKDGKVIPDIYYENGDLYQDFDDKLDMTSEDWNVMSISDDEGCFKMSWTKIDKWCYMEDVVENALTYIGEK